MTSVDTCKVQIQPVEWEQYTDKLWIAQTPFVDLVVTWENLGKLWHSGHSDTYHIDLAEAKAAAERVYELTVRECLVGGGSLND